MICKICKKYFNAKAKDKYLIIKAKTLAEMFNKTDDTVLECFDCPKCGCQNIVNVREGNIIESISVPERST